MLSFIAITLRRAGVFSSPLRSLVSLVSSTLVPHLPLSHQSLASAVSHLAQVVSSQSSSRRLEELPPGSPSAEFRFARIHAANDEATTFGCTGTGLNCSSFTVTRLEAQVPIQLSSEA